MRDRLTADDPETRAAAVAELFERAADEPRAVAEYAFPLTDLVGRDATGRRAAAVLRRVAAAGALDPEPLAARLQAGLDLDRSNRVRRLFADRRNLDDDDLRRVAELLARVAAERPIDAAGAAETLVAALDHESARPGAMRALYHATRRRSPDVSVDAVAAHLSDPDPAVRGDAVAVVGRLGSVAGDSERADAVVASLADEHVAVRQTALGVLDRLSSDQLHDWPPYRLRDALERVAPLGTAPDTAVRERARTVADELARAVQTKAVSLALEGEAGAADALVDAAATDSDLALSCARIAEYQGGKPGADADAAADLAERIADRFDRFDSGDALADAADGSATPSLDAVERLAADLAELSR